MTSALPDLLQRFAATRGDNLAVIAGGNDAIRATQLDAAAWRGVEELRGMGVAAGSVVALHGQPGPAWLAALCACWRLGAVAAPINHRLPAAERSRDAAVLGCDTHWTPLAENLLAGAGAETTEPVEWQLQQPLLRVCTSGSTGRPRCVEITLEQLWFNTLGSNLRIGHRRDDCWLVCLPVNHIGALAAIFRGLHNRISVELMPVFDAAAIGGRLDSGQVSLVSLVPAMLDSILDSRGQDAFAPQLRAILLGGAACSERLLERCRSAGLPVALSWGMTETASQVATRTPGDLGPLHAGIPPLPWVQISADDDGNLVVRGPAARGELVTDDLGEITSTGRVRVLGRRDDVINRGGEKIYPGEIEAVLESHPLVDEAVVIAADEARLGQVPVAFVRSTETDPEALRQWCRKHLAGYKIPERIEVLADFPRTGPGKVDRNALRAMLAIKGQFT